MNNLLNGDDIKTICSLYDVLLGKLYELKKNVLVIEVPVVPRLINQGRDHIRQVNEINEHLKSFDRKMKTKFLPINDLLMTNNEVCMDLYEKEIKIKNKIYPDMVHLNEKGLKLIYDRCTKFIETQRKIMASRSFTCQIKKPSEQNQLVGGPELREELLDENSYNNPVSNQVGTALLELEIMIGEVRVKSIVDSGSQATIMSEDMYDMLKTNSHIEIPELPVTNVSVQGITGVKSKKVNKQIYLPCRLNDSVFDIPCFIVRGIPTILIMG